MESMPAKLEMATCWYKMKRPALPLRGKQATWGQMTAILRKVLRRKPMRSRHGGTLWLGLRQGLSLAV